MNVVGFFTTILLFTIRILLLGSSPFRDRLKGFGENPQQAILIHGRASGHDSNCGSVNTLPMLAGRLISLICPLTTNTIRSAQKGTFSRNFITGDASFKK